jgi:hypothetical protein
MRAALVLFAASVLAAAPALADDDNLNGFHRIFAGWRFNRFVALQIDHVDFEQRYVDARDSLNNFSTEAEGFAPSFVGLLPLGPVELFARGGLLWYDLEIARNTSLADSSERDSIFGAGIGFTIAERLNLRAEYEVVEIDGLDDPNAVWLTAAWRF